MENKQTKRRKIEEGKFKKVIQNTIPEKKGRDDVEEEEGRNTANKKKKLEEPRKFLGAVLKDMEMAEELDWQKHRLEILENIRKEEEARLGRIERAKKLEQSWDLMRQCRRILKENHTKWLDTEERKEEFDKNVKKMEQLEKAAKKKMEFKEKQEIKTKNQKITTLLKTIPKTEAQRIEEEVRRVEKLELQEVKKNLWKKWRGKAKVLDNKTKIPKETDKLDKKIAEIEGKIREYERNKEERLKRKEKKQMDWKNSHRMIIEDTWAMIRWLHQFIDENKFEWERRRKVEIEERSKEGEYERWCSMEDTEMIRLLRESEEKEEVTKEKRKERAQKRNKYWKEWRHGNSEEVDHQEEVKEEEHMVQEMTMMKMKSKEMLEKRKAWKIQKEELNKVKGNKKHLITNKPKDLVMETDPRLDQEPDLINKHRDKEEKLREEEIVEGVAQDQEEAEVRSLLGEEWCMKCAYMPCLCILIGLEERIGKLRESDELEGKEEEAEPDPELREDSHQKFEVPDQGGSPGQDNSAQIPEVILGRAREEHEICKESNAPCKAGPLAELIVEGGGSIQGVEEQKVKKEDQEWFEEEAQVLRDQELVGEVGGENMNLVGLLEGRGTCEGTLTPPEPEPEVPLEDQGTRLEALVPQGVREEDRLKGDKEGVQGNILNRMMKQAREGNMDKQKRKNETPSRKDRKEEKKRKEEASMDGMKNMRMMLKTWTKGGKTVENNRTVIKDVEVVGLRRDLCSGDGVDQKPVEQAGHVGGVGSNGGVGRRAAVKGNDSKKLSVIELARKKFSQAECEDDFQVWKATRKKRKLETDPDESNKEQGKKKIRSPSVAGSSDRFKIKITNQTNQSSCSKFAGRDDWTPDVRVGGAGGGYGDPSSGSVLSEQNMKQRAGWDGISSVRVDAAAELGKPVGE